MISGIATTFWKEVLEAAEGYAFAWPKGYISKKEMKMINALADALIAQRPLGEGVAAAKKAAKEAGFRLTADEEAAEVVEYVYRTEVLHSLVAPSWDALTRHPRY